MLLLFAPLALFAQKFGHVDSQSIIQSLPDYSRAMGELEAKGKELENELQASQAELQRLMEDYNKKKDTMNATQQQETEQKLQEMYAKIQQQAQQSQQEFQKAQQEKNFTGFNEYKGPGASNNRRPVPPQFRNTPSQQQQKDPRMMTKSELKAYKKQEKIEAKFKKEMAKRGGF